MTEGKVPDIPTDDFSLDRPFKDIPLTVRRRLDWSDVDAAQVGYTSRQLDLGIAAIEHWWEQVLGINWFDLRKRGMGSPSVEARIEFYQPIEPGDRSNLEVHLEHFGRSSLKFRTDGYNDRGEKCYTVWLTSVLVAGVDKGKPTSTPLPDDWRRRAEGYVRECELKQRGGKSRREVIDFWFAPPGSPERGSERPIWWRQDANVAPDDFDALIREQFMVTYEAALAGGLDHWLETSAGALALVLCLDQFPRNMFRKSARAFEADGKAMASAKIAIAEGFDQMLDQTARRFLYLPFEHAENLAEQKRSLELFASIGDESILPYVQHHFDIIERFGRFPHRNEVLGRVSTAEEESYIEDPKNRFGQ